MSLKKTDYTIEKGTLKVQFRRGVKVNDKTSSLTVELSLNHKKGLHTINAKWDHDQITFNDEDDYATFETLNELMLEARDYAKKLRKEWEDAQPQKNPDQLGIGFDDDED